MTSVETIVCRVCQTEKDAEKFRVQSYRKLGRDKTCNNCRSLLRREKNEYLAETARRNAKRAGQRIPHVTVADLIDIYEAYPDCPYCGVALSDNNRNIDHVYPLSVTGPNTKINCVSCCANCNASKYTSHVYDYFKRSEKFTDELWRSFIKKFVSRMIKREISDAEVEEMTFHMEAESKELNAWLAKKKGDENVG